MKKILILVALFPVFLSCQSIKNGIGYEVLENENTYIIYKNGYNEDAEYIRNGITDKYNEIIAKINAEYSDPIKVRIYPNARALRSAKNYGKESSQVFVDINDRNEIMIISQSSGDIPYNFDDMRVVVVHEFSHIVSRSLNASLKSNAAWLWEAVAYYNAGQKRPLSYAKRFSDVKFLDIPSKWNDPWISPLSYYIGDFFYKTRGIDGVRKLIICNGNVTKAFNISKEQCYFEWKNYMQNL